jgi:phenylacetate-CoA ligase
MLQVKPAYLYGYVSMIAGLARYVQQHKLPPVPGLRSVITTSEVLDDNSRAVIEDTFQVKVFNEYGCGEVGSIAHECEHGSMHLMADNVIAETDTSNSPDGSSGRLIITDLHNYAMPLIRYDIGDYGTLSDKPCACGRGLPVIERIHGRAYDIIRTADGASFHPEILMYIFEHLKAEGAAISQFQVIQKELDHLHVMLAGADDADISLQDRISRRVHSDIHPKMRLSYEYVDSIAREASGKLRVIKSELV